MHAPAMFLVTSEEVDRSTALDDSHIGMWTIVLFGQFLTFTPSEEEANQLLRVAKKRTSKAVTAFA